MVKKTEQQYDEVKRAEVKTIDGVNVMLDQEGNEIARGFGITKNADGTIFVTMQLNNGDIVYSAD